MSIKVWIGKLNVFYPYNGILFGYKNEWISTQASTGMFLGKSMLSEVNYKDNILCDSIHM